MKKINLSAVVPVIVVMLSIAAFSQLMPVITENKEISLITDTINVEQKKICETAFYDEMQDIYGDCTYYNNYTLCLNTTGPGTGCSYVQDQRDYRCKTGEKTIRYNKTVCRPDDKLIISIDKGAIVAKKQIDYSDFGPCVYEEENDCLILTCQSKYDGANDGKFHGCKSGTSCQKFKICDGSIKTYYKNSREDFAESDPSFFLPELSLEEVEE